MGKHTDQLGSIDNFKAPWESDTGEDATIDPAKLKKYLYGLTLDKAKAQDARDDSADEVAKIEKDLKAAKSDLSKNDPEGKIADLESKLAKAESTATKAQGDLDRLEVGIEKGLTPKQAARLQGETREELEADADEILETFGVAKPKANEADEDEEEEEEEDETIVRRSPLLNASDPKLNKDDGEVDYDQAAAQIMTRRIF